MSVEELEAMEDRHFDMLQQTYCAARQAIVDERAAALLAALDGLRAQKSPEATLDVVRFCLDRLFEPAEPINLAQGDNQSVESAINGWRLFACAEESDEARVRLAVEREIARTERGHVTPF